MKASIFFTFALSALATAATTSSPQPIEKFIAVANETLHELIHFGCHTRDCLKALAPSLATCAFAAAQDELGKQGETLWA